MITRSHRDSSQLTSTSSRRQVTAYAFLTLIAASTFAANLVSQNFKRVSADNAIEVIYLILAVMLLSFLDVRIERGRLSLSGIALGAAALLLNPLDATIVGLSLGIPIARRGRWAASANAVMAGAYVCAGALLAAHLRTNGGLNIQSRFLVVATLHLVGWVLVAMGLSLRTGEGIRSIVRHNFTAQFYVAFGYFTLAAILTSYVLDGSTLGYLLATIVLVLSVALADTIAGRRVRRVLESELSDADRHLFHSRAVEGVVHNLRNHIATVVGYLKEVDPRRLDPVDREAVETATAAANDAATILRTLSQGVTPRVSYASEPVDLNELATRALGMARPRARSKEIELGLRESTEQVQVRADPLLMREVVTNLMNNAIDAAPRHGHVQLSVGRRSNGSPFLSVADDGPGVSDENRHHLFEPHFTTKETGTGLGLFMSYGIIREHQGDLTYSGSHRGAVFTVVLPPFGN